MATDPYASFIGSAPGAFLAKRLGLPRPVVLRRGQDLPRGPIALAVVGGVSGSTSEALSRLGVTAVPALVDDGSPAAEADGSGKGPTYPERLGALVLDATQARHIADLEQVRAALRPALRGLEPSGRVVIIGPDPADAEASGDVEAAAVAQGLEGITRTVGKELRAGATVNLLQLRADAVGSADPLAGPLAFFLQGRSAYVDGQPLIIGAGDTGGPADDHDHQPLTGRVAVITGAARGIGASIARVFAGAGATVVAVDVPASGQALATLTNEIGGVALQLDITAADAGERIASLVASRFGTGGGGEHRPGRIHAMVHNAGITRDKLLANTDAARWASVLEVNLAAQLRINQVLLDGRDGGIAEHGRIISVSSTSGIAGNRGQANYAASKAGVIGLVRALAPTVADRGITVNAVAPGFIETEMTGAIPLATRELGRRINSLQQGGTPVDVAETIAFLAEPGSAGVTGQVLRACGQSLLGA